MEEAQTKGYNAQILTLEVGSHGILNLDGFMSLRELLKTSKRDFTNFLTALARTSISQSHKIWCLRNLTDQSNLNFSVFLILFLNNLLIC